MPIVIFTLMTYFARSNIMQQYTVCDVYWVGTVYVHDNLSTEFRKRLFSYRTKNMLEKQLALKLAHMLLSNKGELY